MRILLTLFFFVSIQPLAAKIYETGIPFITNYAPRDYQASNQNWSIAQERHGLVYVANGKGVLEFDGSRWRLIPLSNNSAALSVTVAKNNTVFVGGKNEFGYLKAESGGMVYHSLVPLLDGIDRDFGDVWETVEVDGQVYFRSNEKLFRYAYNKSPGPSALKIWTPQDRFNFCFNVNDELVIRENGRGMLRMVQDSLRPLPGGERFADESVYGFIPVAPDSYIVVSRRHGLFMYAGSRFSQLDNQTSDFIKKNRAIHTIKLSNGQLAMATNAGVLFIDRRGNIIHHVDKKSGLRGNTVWYLYQDTEGGVWCALNNGVARIELPSPLTVFDDRNNLDGVAQDIIRHQGRIYVATSPAGVFYLDTDKTSDKTPLAHFSHIAGISQQSWQFAHVGQKLVVAATNGVYEISGTKARRILPEQTDLDAACLFSPQYDSSRLFVGLFDGFACLKWQNKRWIFEGRVEEINDEIRSITQDKDGALWLGTRSNGVYRLKYQTTPQFTVTSLEHFSAASGLPAGQVFPFFVDEKIIVTTEHRGLYRYNSDTGYFQPDPEFGPQFSDGDRDVEIIAQNKSGSIVWFGSEEAGRIDQLRRVHGGRYKVEQNALQRLPKSAIRAIYPDVQNIVWVSTNDGLIRYDAAIEKKLIVDYKTLVRRVTVSPDSLLFGGAAGNVPDMPTIQYDNNSLRFEFSAAGYDAPGTLQFQTLLEGFDKTWSAWTLGTLKEYTNLSQGLYNFRVRAQNIYGTQSQEAEYSFRILPPRYRTWWAYGIYFILAGAFVFAVDRFQRDRLLKKARERTRIALLEAENKRKTEELEQARQLQISMLPTELPSVPDADIAVFMKTATEVGGDYYDFILKDGEFIGAIGDATGHGLNAGMMVSIIKGFFVSQAAHLPILDFFKKCNAALKQMRLNRIYMALTIFKIEDKKLKVSSSGMPPIYLYRSTTHQLEEIMLTGMPLGAVLDFDYQCRDIKLESGDIIFFMSDGFPELFNPQNEIIGYDRIHEILEKLTSKAPQDIVSDLVEYAKKWADGRPQDDDMTFVVIKIK